MDVSILAALDWTRVRRSYRLSPREAAIAKLICEGVKLIEVGNRLGICEGTVKTYCRRLYEKLGVSNQCALALTIAAAGLQRAQRAYDARS